VKFGPIYFVIAYPGLAMAIVATTAAIKVVTTNAFASITYLGRWRN
jgi:hypothetical protein